MPPSRCVDLFLSTPSARRATPAPVRAMYISVVFLSTPSARRATGSAARVHRPAYYFYPRPPRGGRRDANEFIAAVSIFLSTPSARRATHLAQRDSGDRRDFYPRPPRGGRHRSDMAQAATIQFLSTPSARRATTAEMRLTRHNWKISIHALREEGDAVRKAHLFLIITISIHALREEGDRAHCCTCLLLRYFYPRPPRGGRLATRMLLSMRL